MFKAFKLLAVVAAIVVLFTIIAFGPLSEDSSEDVQETPPLSAEDRTRDAVILYVGSPAAYVKGVESRIDALDPEVTPVIKNGVRLVPVRFISESLGGNVDWDRETLTVTVTLDEKVIKFKQNSDIMTVGKVSSKLDAPVQAIWDRTFVSLGKIAEALGKEAFYYKGLIIISDMKDILDAETDRLFIDDLISRVSYLPAVGSYEKLKKLLEQADANSGVYAKWGLRKAKALDNGVAANAAKDEMTEPRQAEQAAQPDSAQNSKDYSTTNVQVQGVDEADIVKTDGEYIYQVNRQRVVVARSYPAEEMEITDVLDFTGNNFVPLELYLHEGKLVVIGTAYGDIPVRVMEGKASAETKIYPPPYYRRNTVKTLVFDISDKTDIKKLREVELEGNYVSSRKIGASLYFVANRYMDYYHIMKDDENCTPSYRDTAAENGFVSIDYDKIQYFPGMVETNYMMVAGFNLDKNDEAANISTYLGAGENIYASLENLYIAVTGSAAVEKQAANTISAPEIAGMPVYEENTLVYKFSLSNGKTTFLSKGEVPGTILNQFSMDEHNGYFRIATTRGDTWRNDEYTSKNNVYILDDMLSITGKLEDMAPGEKIYSVRFMGDRGYVVTFKTVDPLFVIDLKDPNEPSVLGALKIPGYSDYLHPYDENHIIGFGKDTVEIKGQAYYLGMKIALFDVSDVKNPVQKFSEVIGDRGTESEILRDHKALLFSKEKGLLAFPVTVMEVTDNAEKVKADSLQYGQFAFQGAYVYSINLDDGFKLKGKITHLTEEEYLKAGNNWYDSNKNINRIIYIGDTLYTLSNSVLKANGLDDMKERKRLLIP